MTQDQTPEQRAASAAESLAADGQAVTARAVRERSGVRMTVASTVARSWNEEQAAAEAVPEVPPAVEARYLAIWREAVVAARDEHAEARAGWQAKAAAAEAERAELAEDIARLEDQGETLRRELAAVTERAAGAAARAAEDLAEARSRADRAEATAAAVTGERDRLLVERDGLREELHAKSDKTGR